LKVCRICKEEKSFDCFVKVDVKYNKSGYTGDCRCCRNERQRKSWAEDPERHRTYGKKYVEANKEKVYKRVSAHRRRNRPAQRERLQRWRDANPHKSKEYCQKYKAQMREIKAKRRAAEKHAMPNWLSKQQRKEIKRLYKVAFHMSEFHEEIFHVDHIEPLRGKTTCGLHVPWNLQILPAKENLKKSNKLLT
jgi:hypothetical protein